MNDNNTDGMERCTFCPNDRYTSLWAQIIDMDQPKEIPVCIDCVDAFETEVSD